MGWRIAVALILPVLWLHRVALPWWLGKLADQDRQAADRFAARGQKEKARARLKLARSRLEWALRIESRD